MKNRLEKLRSKLNEYGAQGALVSSEYNRRYLSGFTGSSGYLVITGDKAYLLTDFRYVEQAGLECPDFEVINFFDKGLIPTIVGLVDDCGIKTLGFENAHMTVKEFDSLSDKIEVEWLELDDTIEGIRVIKDAGEIELIAHAAAIGDKAFSHMLDFIKVGMTETQIAIELEYFMKLQGAWKLSFDSIVVSGVRSSLPHGKPTDKRIEEGDFLTLDFGCIYKGYCSDMTRTIVVGRASDRQKEIYDLVLQAQVNACDKVKAGVIGKEADGYAREVIDVAGYRKNFGHGLGHGLGLEVHEQPRFSLLSEDVVEAGTVMSIEPGIYIPDFGGVRIEDLVLVTEDGIRNFCCSSKELIELGVD